MINCLTGGICNYGIACTSCNMDCFRMISIIADLATNRDITFSSSFQSQLSKLGPII